MQMTASASRLSNWWRHCASKLLAASWGLGFIGGSIAAKHAEAVLVPLVRQCAGAEASVPGLLAVTTLPILLAAFAISFSEPWLLLFISMFKAFNFSFCGWGVCLAFGQSGWLVLFLLMFSDLFLIPVQYFYWLRHIRGDTKPTALELPLFLGSALLVGGIDYWFIAPFLASLMR